MHPKFVRKEALDIFAFLTVPYVHTYASLAVMGILILRSLKNADNAIKALAFGIFIVIGNPGISENHPSIASLKWILLIFAFGSIILHSQKKGFKIRNTAPLLISLWLFCVVAAVLSIISSRYLTISIFRLFSFAIGATTLIIAFRISPRSIEEWKNWFFTFYMVLCALSLLLVFHPWGYFRNGSGFQGITVHPQTLGVLLTPIASYVALKLITLTGRLKLFVILLILLTMLWLSGARTAMLALVLSFGFTILFAAYYKGLISKSKVTISILSVAAITVLSVIFFGEQLEPVFAAFVDKSQTSTTFDDVNMTTEHLLMRSRGPQIENLIRNIEYQPLWGVGFGMDGPYGVRHVETNALLGVPISAPVEAGFLPLAIVSQTGVIGTVFFLLFIGRYLAGVFRSHDAEMIAFATGALFVNLGEAIFFSLGGSGMWMWIILAFCFSAQFKLSNEYNIVIKNNPRPLPDGAS